MLPTELGLLCPPLNALLHTTLPRGVVQCGGHLLRSLLSGYVVFQVAEPEACDQMYESLARLHSNYYKHKVSGHGPCSQPPMGELIIQCFCSLWFKCNQYFQLRQQWCPAEAFKGLLNKSHNFCVLLFVFPTRWLN